MTVPGPSKTEQILAHVVSELNAAYGVSGRVYRDRAEAFLRAELPALLVEPGQEDSDYGHTSCRMRHVLTLLIEVLVDGGAVSLVADPIRCSVHSILIADQTLGGLARSIRPARKGSTQWMPEKGDNQPGRVGMLFEIEFLTLDADLAS